MGAAGPSHQFQATRSAVLVCPALLLLHPLLQGTGSLSSRPGMLTMTGLHCRGSHLQSGALGPQAITCCRAPGHAEGGLLGGDAEAPG